MEEKVEEVVKVWGAAIACLGYCYLIPPRIPKGLWRLLSLLPILYIFYELPWALSTLHLRGISAFFLTWLSNFKLLLLSFHRGPLIPHLSSFPHFLSTACLPINFTLKDGPTHRPTRIGRDNLLGPIRMGLNALLLGLIIYCYRFREKMPEKLLLCLYCFHIYFSLEVVLAIGAALARALVHMELDPQFNNPFLSSSLQDFWGRRWNLMVTGILKPTIYGPVCRVCKGRVGKKWAQVVAVMATFVVSALMHELMFCYLTDVGPTWEVTLFFLLHGLCLVVEIALKSALAGKCWLPHLVSGPLTLAFVAVTAFWLFFPPLVRSRADQKVIAEYSAMVDLLKTKAGI